ncbi:YfhO family protein [Candidatus Roizmanbacteria bacterium]|nr:YfhO family protein [Candidatus Roizmanbacteria bacterium]
MDMIEKRKDSQVMVFLAFLCLLFFFDVLFLGNVFYAGDNLSINVPSKILFFRMLSQRQLPLWNPYIFSGTPFLADINLGLLSPFNIFYLFFTPLCALSFSIISAVLFAGVSMYWLGKSLKLSRFASVISAVVFMFSGSLMTHTMNTAILNTIVWLPLLLTSIKRLIEVKKVKYAMYSSILLTLSLFGGHIQYFYYIAIFSFFFILCQPIPWKEKIKYVSFVFIPTLFLSAIQLLPFLEYSQFSTRPQFDINYAHGSTSLFSYIHLLIPNFFGVMKDGTSWGATADINGFIGIIPLLLAIWVLIKVRIRWILFFSISAIVTLLLALGKYSPLYLLAFYFVPFFSRFRSPTSILLIYTFSLSVLAGYGADYLFQKSQIKTKERVSSLLVALISSVALLFLVLYVRLNLFSQFITTIKTINVIKKTAFFTRFLEYSSFRMHIIYNLWTENIMILSFFLALFLLFILVLTIQKCITQVQKFIFILLIVTELFIFGSNNYIVSREKDLQTPKEIVEFFQKNSSHFRVLTMIDPGAKPPFADPTFFQTEGIKAMDFYQANTNIFQGIEIVGGYASIVHKDYSNYISPNKSDDPTGITLLKPGMKQLDELGVKYIITAGRYEKELRENEQYKLVFKYRDERIKRTFGIYQNLKSFPRVYVLNSKNEVVGLANIVSYKENEIKISVASPEKGKLILADMYYPGWSAKVNNKKVSIAKYKVFRSVPLEKGKSEIVFTYLPKGFIIGATLSLANWMFVFVFLGFILIKEHKYISKPLHIGKAKIKKNAK